MAKISVGDGPSDAVTGQGMPEPTDGTSYDDTPGANGPAVQAHGPAELNGGIPDDEIARSAPFDPDKHNAEEVAAYLSDRRNAGEHDEAQRVADAERSGRNRKSALVGEG